ncbi:pentapeptide repeat-containing protein [Micromonospora sp. CPCC 205371]|nr:pentapeptide repeat-containing protein [Micromonospora sp. CPCC 205371]
MSSRPIRSRPARLSRVVLCACRDSRVLGAVEGWPAAARAYSFDRAVVDNEAAFYRAVFHGDASFVGARFTGHAEFGRARFRGHADFSGAAFGGMAWFGRGAHTWWDDDERWATVEEIDPAPWDEPNEDDPDWPVAVLIEDYQDFEEGGVGALFTGEVSFRDARFVGPAWFYNARFGATAAFTGAHFAGRVHLDQPTVDLTGAQWGGGTARRVGVAAGLDGRTDRFGGGRGGPGRGRCALCATTRRPRPRDTLGGPANPRPARRRPARTAAGDRRNSVRDAARARPVRSACDRPHPRADRRAADAAGGTARSRRAATARAGAVEGHERLSLRRHTHRPRPQRLRGRIR